MEDIEVKGWTVHLVHNSYFVQNAVPCTRDVIQCLVLIQFKTEVLTMLQCGIFK